MICPTCHGNGYARQDCGDHWLASAVSDLWIAQCETCGSQGEIEESRESFRTSNSEEDKIKARIRFKETWRRLNAAR